MAIRTQLTALATLVIVSAAAGAAPPPPKVDPVAIAALVTMGTFVRAQPRFEVKTRAATDTVLADGQKVQLLSRGDIRIQRPNELRAETVSDRKHRQFYYDGKTFTLNGPRTGFYAQVAAPPTLAELAAMLQDRYGVDLPLVDLFSWGTAGAGIDQIKSAQIVGTETIDGVPTTQYAFHQDGLDWQVWIENGPRPVPRRLVLTTLTDPARPEHTIDMTWNLDPKFEPNTFAFNPPPDSHKIELVAIGEKRGGKP